MATLTDDKQHQSEDQGGSQGASAVVRNAASKARSAVGDAYGGAREKVSGAYEGARETMADAYAVAREKASDARRRTAEGVDENPVAAVIGGLALGAVVAALVPRSEREAKALAPVGEKLSKAAKDAVDAAKSAGKEKIGELGLERARDSVRKIVGDAVGAADATGGRAS